MSVPHLQLDISDVALMASSDGAYSEVELHASRKFANPRLSALVAAVHAEMTSAGERSCSKAPSCADIPRRTRISALAKD